jgi:alpha-beta hydrolase superfamily lysophospholipase
MMSRQDCSLLDQPAVLRVMFYPRRDFRPDHIDDRDVFFTVADGIRINGRLHAAAKDSPTILLFHGNGEIASDYEDIAALYTMMGISLLIADYRGYGKSDGTPTASALLDDAMAVYRQTHDFLSQHGLDASRLFLMGRSLGSAAALEIASQVGDEIRGLIIESGFASALGLVERLGGSVPEHLKDGASGFDNDVKMEHVRVPTLIIHGEIDQIIPVTNGETLHSRCAADQKRLVIIPQAGHNDLLFRGQDVYFVAVREFMFG